MEEVAEEEGEVMEEEGAAKAARSAEVELAPVLELLGQLRMGSCLGRASNAACRYVL